MKHQAYCPTCKKLVGKVRKYHDSAVEEALKHEDMKHGRDTRFKECVILSATDSYCLKVEASYM